MNCRLFNSIHTLLFATSMLVASGVAWGDPKVSEFQNFWNFAQFLDETSEYRISATFGKIEGTAPTEVSGTFIRNRKRAEKVNQLPPNEFTAGLQVKVNGVVQEINERTAGPVSEFEYMEWKTHLPVDRPVTIEFSFYDVPIGKYQIDRKTAKITELMKPKHLSAFDLRQFHLLKYKYVAPWRKKSVMVENGGRLYSQVDLHTHYGGAPRAESIIEVATTKGAPYPTELLDELDIKYSKSAIILVEGKPHVPLSVKNVKSSGLNRLYQHLSIGLDETVPFEKMEKIYKYRAPILKNRELFAPFLRELANDYKAMGVHYAELSLSDVLKPDWMEIIRSVVPEIEKETGVKLRFMAALWRHSDKEYNQKLVKEIKALRGNPYVVGVDVMGAETNATRELSDVLKELSDYRVKQNPSFQIRVHAGENAAHPGNIREAIELGATRIGHGIYGVDDEVLRLAKEKGVIIEFNSNSNLALQNIGGAQALPAKKYLDAGVRVTIGTDGHGIYNTSAQSEEAVLKSAGLSNADFEKIRASDQKYVRDMNAGYVRQVTQAPGVPVFGRGCIRRGVEALEAGK